MVESPSLTKSEVAELLHPKALGVVQLALP